MRITGDDKWRVKVLETHCILALAALLGGLIAGIRTFFWIGVVLLALAIVAQPVAAFLTRGWLWFAEMISIVNSSIVLTVLYYLILVPIAIVYRFFNKDPLNLLLNNNASFYSERNHTYSKTDLDKMW